MMFWDHHTQPWRRLGRLGSLPRAAQPAQCGGANGVEERQHVPLTEPGPHCEILGNFKPQT